LLVRIVDLAVERRRLESTLLGDPVIVRFYSNYQGHRRVMRRLHRMLMGDDAGPRANVRAAMLLAAIGGAVMHPLVSGLNEDTMRAELLRLARRFLDLPD
jgi:hypothetical protein